jgi:hypothetical protein
MNAEAGRERANVVSLALRHRHDADFDEQAGAWIDRKGRFTAASSRNALLGLDGARGRA